MRCAYCGRNCDDRPNRIEAMCWKCWYDKYGKAQAVREWKRKRWWRRLIP